jgi:polyferredoxin
MTVILGLVIYLALGYGARPFEAYCPFGGMESLWGLFKTSQFSCALGPTNLSLLVAILGLTILTKKSFCGWACPIGFLGELAGKFGGKCWSKRPSVPKKTNGALKLLRYVVLVISLYYTYKIGELVLRGYDPFYIIFSGFGHGTLGTISYISLAIIIAGGLLIPMFFCRYLCPLSATFDPFSRLGLVKITRNDATCTHCGNCNEACPHDLQPMQMKAIRHRDCTNCLECLDACPVKDVMKLKATL